MTLLESLVSPANLPFTIALGTGLGLALVQATGLTSLFSDGDGHEHQGDSYETGGDDVHGEAHATEPGGVLPLSLSLQAVTISFGLSGLVVNTLGFVWLKTLPLWMLTVSMPVSVLVATLSVRLVQRLFRRVTEHGAVLAPALKDLVGREGVIISSKADKAFGEVRIRVESSGHTVRMICRTLDEVHLHEGETVVVVDLDPETQRLLVASMDRPSSRDNRERQDKTVR